MKSGKKPAKRGYKYQKRFVKLVNENLDFNNQLRSIMGISDETLKAIEVTDIRKKADVELIVAGKAYGCSIKTSEANFSQLDRRWLSDLSSVLSMPMRIKNALEDCIVRKRTHKKGKFIFNKHAPLIIRYFASNISNLLKEIFTRNDENLIYFIVCDYAENIWHIMKMEDVISLVQSQALEVSSKGILKFGEVLSLQRKGGNGKHIKLPKSHPNHPGNQLQFKVKPLTIVSLMPQDKIFHIHG